MSDEAPTRWADVALALAEGHSAPSRAVGKLIRTVADQIGLTLQPWHTRRQARADAAALVAQAEGRAQVAAVEEKSRAAIEDLKDRAAERVRRREERRQRNLEAIAGRAADRMPEAVSDDPVDPDWLEQFFDSCQDVSNEQMQSVWARLLAGEVAAPGSFSKRTLAFVRVLGRDEAELFSRFCKVIWTTAAGPMPFLIPHPLVSEYRPVAGLQFIDLVRLESVGLITHSPAPAHFSVQTADRVIGWDYFGRRFVLRYRPYNPSHPWSINIGPAMLTDVGKELAPIAGASADEEYLALALEGLRGQGCDVLEGAWPARDEPPPGGSTP